MRIIGEIPHSSLKITVFEMGNRLSVKFEFGLMEQTYKFRKGDGLQTFNDVHKMLDKEFVDRVAEQFSQMEKVKSGLTRRFYPRLDREFEEII